MTDVPVTTRIVVGVVRARLVAVVGRVEAVVERALVVGDVDAVAFVEPDLDVSLVGEVVSAGRVVPGPALTRE